VETLSVVNDVEKGGEYRSGEGKRAESCEPFIEVSLAKYDVETDLARKSREASVEGAPITDSMTSGIKTAGLLLRLL
jgi:hypothetical protein